MCFYLKISLFQPNKSKYRQTANVKNLFAKILQQFRRRNKAQQTNNNNTSITSGSSRTSSSIGSSFSLLSGWHQKGNALKARVLSPLKRATTSLSVYISGEMWDAVLYSYRYNNDHIQTSKTGKRVWQGSQL